MKAVGHDQNGIKINIRFNHEHVQQLLSKNPIRNETIMIGAETIVCSIGTSLSQAIYEALGNSKKILVELCFGLKNADGTPLIDIDSNPWRHGPKGVVKAANRELAFEVQRRQKLFATCEIFDNADRMKPMMKPRNKPWEH